MAFVPYHAHLNVQGMAGSKRRVNRYTLESNYIVQCSPLTSALQIFFNRDFEGICFIQCDFFVSTALERSTGTLDY